MSGFAATRARDANRLADEAPVWLRRTLERDGWTDFTFAFHDSEELGRAMLKRIARATGPRPEDL